ncbi:MAG: hypothetical protein D3922_13370 [Candidatus Electrothrix sp. AR1]|nr:hypothetical protein [Candidatus Electrothrix sp. AR1]
MNNIIFRRDMPVDHSECFKNDHLKFENSIKKLATIFSIIHPPFTIAVYGKWGTGKTSYMKLLLSQLESDLGCLKKAILAHKFCT